MYESRENERISKFPFVLVHGFMGWGEDDGVNKLFPYWGVKKERSVTKVLRNAGFECYAPSVGPFHSAWDRACELYTRLVGGTVDYGKVHAEKYGHNRYGRTYKALIPDWGKLDGEGRIKKINLIGHSWGGPSTRMLIELLARGSEAERAGTSESELSDLFRGGKQYWVHSETTLAAVQNGSFFASSLGDRGVKIISGTLLGIGMMIGETPLNKLYDFRLDHYNVSTEYQRGFKIRITDKKLDGFKAYKNNTIDNVGHEMGAKYCQEITKDFNTFDNIYYFSYAGCTTVKQKDSERHIPLKRTCLIMKPFARLGGFYKNPDHGIDEAWFPNDGMVSVVGAAAPFNEPQVDFTAVSEIKPGIWHKMPLEEKDHISYMGVGEAPGVFVDFFMEIFERVSALPAIG